MVKEYLIQLSPFCESDFLKEYGEIFYQADSFSNIIGISSTLDLLEIFEKDHRVKLVRYWNDLSYEI